MEKVPVYNALALQINTEAINTCENRTSAQPIIDANLANIEKYLGGSKAFISVFSGTAPKLVVLPEYCLTGFPMGESLPAWQEKACLAQDGPEYERLAAIAQNNDLYLSGNVYELDPHFPKLYFQTSFIIAPNGNVVCRYRRLISMFAPTPHDVLDAYLDHYGADSLFPVADTEIGRLACVASEEILYPELTRALTMQGAEVICHSSSEVGAKNLTPKNIAKRARAYENMCYVVSANSASITGSAIPAHSTTGGSQVVDYKGEVLVEALAGESMNGNAMVNIEELRRVRRKPAMTNTVARQRFEIFKDTYSKSIYPANNIAENSVPERAHFLEAQAQVISNLLANGVLK